MKYMASVILQSGSAGPSMAEQKLFNQDSPLAIAKDIKNWFKDNPPPFGIGGNPTQILVTDSEFKSHVFDYGEV